MTARERALEQAVLELLWAWEAFAPGPLVTLSGGPSVVDRARGLVLRNELPPPRDQRQMAELRRLAALADAKATPKPPAKPKRKGAKR